MRYTKEDLEKSRSIGMVEEHMSFDTREKARVYAYNCLGNSDCLRATVDQCHAEFRVYLQYRKPNEPKAEVVRRCRSNLVESLSCNLSNQLREKLEVEDTEHIEEIATEFNMALEEFDAMADAWLLEGN